MAATRVQFRQEALAGDGILAFTSNNTAGNLIVVWYAGTIGAFTNTVTDSVGNTYTSGFKMNLGFGNCLEMFYAWNIGAGANTVTATGIGSNVFIAIAEYSGVKNSSNPFLDGDGTSGDISPLEVPLSLSAPSLVVSGWYNNNADDYTGVGSGMTAIQHGVLNPNAQAEALNVAAGTFNSGFTIGGVDATNVMAALAFELASGSSTGTQTQLGKSRITISSNQTQSGKANIAAQQPIQTQLGQARIDAISYYGALKYFSVNINDWVFANLKTYMENISMFAQKPMYRWSAEANAWLILNTTGNGGGSVNRLKYQFGKAKIISQGTGNQPINGLARIRTTNFKVQTGQSRITGFTLKTQLGKANISGSIGTFTLSETVNTTVGIYDADDKLVRSLWFDVEYGPGTHDIPWDGTSDSGANIIGLSTYTAKVACSNILAMWFPAANTSTNTSGTTVLHSYSQFFNVCISGNNVYIGEGYNEAGARKGFKVLQTAIQECIPILPQRTDPNGVNPNDTDLETWYNCTNGTNVYWCGIDPGAGFYGTGGSWAFGTTVSNDTNVAFSSGSSIKAGFGAVYPNAFDIVLNQPTNVPTGMCCNNSYVWIARGSTNTIYCYNATTAALVTTITGFTNPRELAYDPSNGGRVWFISDTNTLRMTTVNSGTGALTNASHTLTIPSEMKALGVDSTNGYLGIATGGTNQQIWEYNIAGANPAGADFRKVGQAGGYQTNTVVANDKFYLADYLVDTNLNKTYVAYDSSGNIYVGDVGCARMQKFDSSRNFVASVQQMGALYSVSSDMQDATRAFAYFYEFDVATNGAFTFVRNFRAFLTAANVSTEYYNIFQWCATLNGGRLYATLQDLTTNFWPTVNIVELSDTGIRDTGYTINPSGFFNGYLDKDFNIIETTSSGGNFGAGQTVTVKNKAITSWTSNNPNYGSQTNIVTFSAPIASGDAIFENYQGVQGITTSGLAIVANDTITETCTYHMQAYSIATGDLMWSTFRKTSKPSGGFDGYVGEYPSPFYNDIGNGVAVTIEDAQCAGDITAVLYHGEFWEASQTNYTNLYLDNGLPIIQFGTNLRSARAIGESTVEAAGNSLSYRFTKIGTTYYLYHCDESIHSALHSWIVEGIDDVYVLTAPMSPPTYPTLEGIDLLASVTFNSIITNTGNITRSNAEGSGFKAQSGNTSYDFREPDIYLQLAPATAPSGAVRYVDLAITPAYNPSLTSFKVWGDINFRFGGGGEATSTPTMELQVLDDVGLTIAEITLGQQNVIDEFYLRLNSSILLQYTDANTSINIVQEWQPFTIVTTASGCTITYGNYTPVVVALSNPSAHWNKPTTVRLQVKDLNGAHAGTRTVGTKLLRYVDYV